MKAQEARELGYCILALVEVGQSEQAYDLLAPVLDQRTPFVKLNLIGQAIGAGTLEPVNVFLERIAAEKTEGGWVVIGAALAQQLDRDRAAVFDRCCGFIVAANVWYAADILGERLPGPALVTDFEPALALLTPWRTHPNPWVRRTVGISVHFWAKRSQGASTLAPQAQELLAFLDPMFEEQQMKAVKGIAWGLKTLGRYYPDLVADWLAEQVVHRRRCHRALMQRKALTFLSEEQRAFATQGIQSA